MSKGKITRRNFVKAAALAPLAVSPLVRAQEAPKDDRYDIVVAGGGHNSLVTTAYLAKAGYRCIVLEGRPIVGGGVKTAELMLRGFHDDVCSTAHTYLQDNPMIRELMCRAMESHCDVISSSDGADGLLKSIDNPPDLIISDFRMPGLDGRQLFEKLRGRENTRNIPFVFVASRGDIEEKLRPAVGGGVEDFIPKPFFVADLVRQVKKSWTVCTWKRCRSMPRVPESSRGGLRK